MMRALADGLLALALAPACAACQSPLDRPAASAVCAGCWRAIRLLAPPLCPTCGDPLPSWRADPHAGGRCAMCRGRSTPVSLARAVGEYEGSLQGILHALKYGGRRSLAPGLSALMRERGREVLDGADCVVPVPLHWFRHWTRGFNQAADLAADLGLPVLHALRRTRHTGSQTALAAGERHANLRGAFRVRRGIALGHARVVLVDDVSTTGATLDACAHALRRAGVREVRALTAARVVTRRPPALPR
jgi:ComF family protein